MSSHKVGEISVKGKWSCKLNSSFPEGEKPTAKVFLCYIEIYVLLFFFCLLSHQHHPMNLVVL